MKKIIIAVLGAALLSGCTVVAERPVIYQPRPVIYPQTTYYVAPRPVPVVRHRPYCFTNWVRTPYGLQQQQVCR